MTEHLSLAVQRQRTVAIIIEAKVYAGLNDVGLGQTRVVSKVHYHPHSKRNVCLIELDEPFYENQNELIQPICLPSRRGDMRKYDNEDQCVFAGFGEGSVTPDGEPKLQARKFKYPTFDYQFCACFDDEPNCPKKCISICDVNIGIRRRLAEINRIIFAKGKHTGRGDSGGTWACYRKGAPGRLYRGGVHDLWSRPGGWVTTDRWRWEIVGVDSGSDDQGVHSRANRVISFLDWIESVQNPDANKLANTAGQSVKPPLYTCMEDDLSCLKVCIPGALRKKFYNPKSCKPMVKFLTKCGIIKKSDSNNTMGQAPQSRSMCACLMPLPFMIFLCLLFLGFQHLIASK